MNGLALEARTQRLGMAERVRSWLKAQTALAIAQCLAAQSTGGGPCRAYQINPRFKDGAFYHQIMSAVPRAGNRRFTPTGTVARRRRRRPPLPLPGMRTTPRWACL